MQLHAHTTSRHWPLWRQITLALLGAMAIISFLAAELVRRVETTYLQENLHKQSQKHSRCSLRLPLTR